MTTQDIYRKFQTPKNLQEHMLQVAAVAQIVLDGWTGEELDETSIIQACLLHDIAKPMNFNLSKQAQFGMSPEDIEQLAQLQTRLRADYAPTEHEAAVKICQEVGSTALAVDIVDQLEWEYTPRLLKEKNYTALMAIYADMRVAPHGIMPLVKRIEELKTRDHDSDELDELSIAGQELEDLLQKQVSFDLNAIDSEQIHMQVQGLRAFEFGANE